MPGICRLSVLVFHETLLVFILMNDSKTMQWREKDDLELGNYGFTDGQPQRY